MTETSFGKYKLIAELGHGGMADVFLAVQGGPTGSGFRKLTVVKRLRQNLADEPEFVAMLVDEARIAARLNHPNVVQTNEVGDWQGSYFIAMEYLDGQPLHRIQHRSAQRAKDGSVPIFGTELQYIVLMDVLAGLHHAHELLDYDGTPLEIVHRDMTPHNIFVTYEGQVKVVDFGIAKAAGRASETRQGIIKGKVRYMAPEQAVGRAVDRRVDVFAIGIILWEAATGKRMWKDKDDLQIVHALISGEIPRSPRSVNPDVPEAIDLMCQKALAQNPEDRHPTADAFRAELEQYLMDSGILSRARRQMPAALDTLFRDKRTEIRQLIEKQLAEVDTKGTGEFAAVAIPASNPSLPSVASASASQSIVTGHATSSLSRDSSRDSQVIAVEPPPKSRPLLAAFGAAVLLALIVVFGIVAVIQRDGRGAATQLTDITVRVNATPATARVSFDDGQPEQVPVARSVPRDGKPHKIRVEAEGYDTKTDLVTYTQDMVLSFDLLKHNGDLAPSTSIASATVAKHPPPPGPGVAPWKPSTPTGPATKHTGAPPTAPTETTPPPPTNTAPTAPVVTAPPTNTMTTAPTAPPVDVAKEHRKTVNATVRGHAGEVQACYDRAKMQSPQLAGSVAVAATLTAGGSAPNAHVASSTVRGAVGNGPAMLEACLVERFRSWTFTPAPPGASNDISYTFKFE